MSSDSKPKAALVLSGGGALGAAHLGVLRVLEPKFRFDMLCGVSAGAIVAAAVACGKTADQISAFLHEQNFFRLAFDFAGGKFGLVRGEKILALLRQFFEERQFSDLAPEKELLIGATDFATGDQVLLSMGDIAAAVRASLSVPLLFEPFEYQGRLLVDGGLAQNFPIDAVLSRFTGETIIGVDVCGFLSSADDFFAVKVGRLRQMQRILERSFRILFRNQQHFPPDARLKIIRPKLTNFSTLDIGALREIEICGEEAARAFLNPDQSFQSP